MLIRARPTSAEANLARGSIDRRAVCFQDGLELRIACRDAPKVGLKRLKSVIQVSPARLKALCLLMSWFLLLPNASISAMKHSPQELPVKPSTSLENCHRQSALVVHDFDASFGLTGIKIRGCTEEVRASAHLLERRPAPFPRRLKQFQPRSVELIYAVYKKEA